MKILSVDQSSTATGFSIFDDKQLIKYGVIKSKCETFEDKILDISSQITKIINDFHIDLVLLEDVQNQKNLQTFKKLSIFEGVLMKTSHFEGTSYLIIPSSTWRVYLKKNVKLPYHNNKRLQRKELKEMSKQLVYDIYKIKVSDDIADSIVMALYYFNKEMM